MAEKSLSQFILDTGIVRAIADRRDRFGYSRCSSSYPDAIAFKMSNWDLS